MHSLAAIALTRALGVRIEIPEGHLSGDDVIGSFRGRPDLYIHVPFCKTICPFCPYNKVRYDKTRVAGYFAALRREAAAYTSVTADGFGSLYIGGGTPTLCLDELEEFLPLLPTVGERAIEVLPNHMTADIVRRLRGLGIDYVSIGAQSFQSDVLRRLGRPNTVAMNHEALEHAVGSFRCVDVDLIFDADRDDPSALLSDLSICFAAGVDQVSTYPLMRFGYTRMAGQRQAASLAEHRALREAGAIAADYGFERRAVWTFNRVGSPSYTSITREFYLGLGAGAASFTGSAFLTNHFGIDRYIEATTHRLPIARMIHLRSLAEAAFFLFWQAYSGRVDLDRFHGFFGAQHSLSGLLGLARAAGSFSREGHLLRLTQKGYDRYHDLEQWVTYTFIEPLWAQMMREHDPQSAEVPVDLGWRRSP